MASPIPGFYEIQKRQKSRTAVLLPLLFLFYFASVGLLGLGLVATLNLFAASSLLGPGFLGRFLILDAAASIAIAAFHYHDARAFGAAFILRRLQARPPDPADRYHVRFANTLDEMRIAAGLPLVRGYVLPSFAVNSLAVIESDGTPAVAVTEGLLADFARDEIAAVAAHELAHVVRGDTLYVTLVCSLANFFEKIREMLEPERVETAGPRGRGQADAAPVPVFLYAAAALSGFVMHLLSTLISRQRELLADAAAVELNRDPEALARALHRAHVKNAFVGDFSRTYAPLFIVPPDGGDIADGLLARIFTTHPPFRSRFEALAAMAHKSTAELVEEAGRRDDARAEAQTMLRSAEETAAAAIAATENTAYGESAGDEAPSGAAIRGSGPGVEPCPPHDAASPGLSAADGHGPGTFIIPVEPSGTGAAGAEPKIWSLSTGADRWEGPFTTVELLAYPAFTTMALVRNLQEGVTAKAREFPQLRAVLRRISRRGPTSPRTLNLCPRCGAGLARTFYEGVGILACARCRGKLVAMDVMDRIIARREVTFSEDLCAKARAFRERVLLNPLKKLKPAAEAPGAPCPRCGERMVQRPYNYQYFVLVDKCLACSRIWFDADELEILQLLIER